MKDLETNNILVLAASLGSYRTYMEEFDTDAALQAARNLASIVRQALAHTGHADLEIRRDEVVALYDAPDQALQAARELQTRAAVHTLESDLISAK